MRVLLVTAHEFLPFAVTQVLNARNEYCAVVVDEVEPARKFLSQFNYSAENVSPLYELPECVENFFYDCIICMTKGKLLDEIKRCGVPKNKLVTLFGFNTAENFLLDRGLRYYQKNFSDFEMFASGMSYSELGLLPKIFTRKLFNFSRPSQDLYFDFQVAKKVISIGGGILTYALIGLAPYSFYYDESKTSAEESPRLAAYAFTLKDLHNFWLPVEKYRSLFREEYLNIKMPIDDIEIDEVSVLGDYSKQHIDFEKRVASRKRIDVWQDRNFPDTREENIKILDDYLTLCEENKIVPIMFLPPMTEGYKKYFSKQKLNEFYFLIRSALAKHQTAKFIDGWALQGLSDADFLDVDHLNYNGAIKFSRFLNGFIEKI